MFWSTCEFNNLVINLMDLNLQQDEKIELKLLKHLFPNNKITTQASLSQSQVSWQLPAPK